MVDRRRTSDENRCVSNILISHGVMRSGDLFVAIGGTTKGQGGVGKGSTVHPIDAAGISLAPVARSAAQLDGGAVARDGGGRRGSAENEGKGEDVSCVEEKQEENSMFSLRGITGEKGQGVVLNVREYRSDGVDARRLGALYPIYGGSPGSLEGRGEVEPGGGGGVTVAAAASSPQAVKFCKRGRGADCVVVVVVVS